MKKRVIVGVAVLAVAMVASVVLAATKFKATQFGTRVSGGAVTNTTGNRVALASVFFNGSFGVTNIASIKLIQGSPVLTTNLLVRRVATNSIAWVDEGGAVPWERGGVILFELTNPGPTSSYQIATFQ